MLTWPLVLSALLLGLVQGLTEFIPVSSSGHLILAGRGIDFEEAIGGRNRLIVFEVVIQLGSVVAILVEYGRDLLRTARSLLHGNPGPLVATGAPPASNGVRGFMQRSRLGVALIVGTVPVLVVGALFGGLIQDHLFSPVVVAWSFIIGGVIMWVIESLPLKPTCASVDTISIRQALVVGFAQVLALVPGTSRSGSTIMGALGAGLDRRTATEFSFLLALPVLLAASAYTVVRNVESIDASFFPPLALGFLVSFLSSWLVIRWLLRFVRSHTFKGFALYRIGFGLVLLLVLR
jgi:undecaprenyl-diphosphatase